MNKRILVVSNEVLSSQSSNGRTLLNFLRKVPQENLFQFCLKGWPDDGVCSEIYKVSDSDALKALFFKRVSGHAKKPAATETPFSTKPKSVNRSRTLLLRDFIWRSYLWWNKSFDDFLSRVSPELVLFQAGDSPFMYYIALRIAKKFHIPIVMYNSENYVLKDKLFNSAKKNSPWHIMLQKRLRKAYKKMMDAVFFCIYSTEYLEESYQKAYPHPGKSIALYISSEFSALPDNASEDRFNLLYCGNLGVGRAEALSDFAKILKKVSPNAVLDVYGKFAEAEDKNLLLGNSNVNYGGIVPYSEIPGLMSRASMLLHCENPERLKDLIGAFSTKIADSLASGRPFLVYAAKEYPFVKYLEKNNCVHIATTPAELEMLLKKCINDEIFRNSLINNALKTVEKNHRAEKSSEKFLDILAGI